MLAGGDIAVALLNLHHATQRIRVACIDVGCDRARVVDLGWAAGAGSVPRYGLPVRRGPRTQAT